MTDIDLERLIFHWPAVTQRSPKGWARDFATSVLKQCRRRNWKPTPKQAAIMQRMVSELFTHPAKQEADFSLIED